MNIFRRTIIIAEAGVNHNGDLSLAKKLIEAAAESGADFVKFQTFNADDLVTESASKAEYQKDSSEEGQTQHQMLKALELTREMHVELINHCELVGIKFLSTGFDIESIDLLLEMGVDFLKIPSGEITNVPYLRYIGKVNKPVIISTGMAGLAEVANAIDILEKAGTTRKLMTILHCTTEYPAKISEINLRAIPSMKTAFGVDIGYSDHTLGIEASIAAVALGAVLIEKHFTLDRNLPGPDHKASLEPYELKQMVSAIRNIEMALGDGIKKPTKAEIVNRVAARKSLVAKREIKKGEIFSAINLEVKRPGNGISPVNWDFILGLTAKRDFMRNELIEI